MKTEEKADEISGVCEGETTTNRGILKYPPSSA